MMEGVSDGPLRRAPRVVTGVCDKIFSTPHRDKGAITNQRNTTWQNLFFKKCVLEKILNGRRTLGKSRGNLSQVWTRVNMLHGC